MVFLFVGPYGPKRTQRAKRTVLPFFASLGRAWVRIRRSEIRELAHEA